MYVVHLSLSCNEPHLQHMLGHNHVILLLDDLLRSANQIYSSTYCCERPEKFLRIRKITLLLVLFKYRHAVFLLLVQLLLISSLCVPISQI